MLKPIFAPAIQWFAFFVYKMIKRYLAALFFQTVFLIAACAQSPGQVLQWMNTVKTAGRNFYYEIPFEYRNNEIVIKVTIGGQAYDYIFDTGGYNDITDEIQAKNNFPVLTTQTVGSANRLKAKVNVVKVDSMKIGPLVFEDVTALQMNFDKSPAIKCTINGALIGASIIKNYAWQIDYPNKKIIVTDQFGKLPNLDNAIKVPVSFNSRLMPYINAKIDGTDERFMFDLGSSSFCILNEKTAGKYLSTKQVVEINGGSSEGGNGIVNEAMKMIKCDSLDVASIRFKNKPMLFLPTANECLIGNPVIKNFIVTLNFQNNELYLTLIEQQPVEPGWATFGFGAKYVDGKVLVTTIYSNLAADKAGLVMNDELIAIDGNKTADKGQCEVTALLNTLLNSATQITLTVLRNGSPKDISITKAKVF